MKLISLRTLPLLMATCAALTANVVPAASILEFDIWMRKIDKRILDVQRTIHGRDAPAAIAHAKEIETLYRLMEEYFISKGKADDAVNLSVEGRSFAGTIAKAVESNDYDTALRAALGIAKACSTCHDAYKPFADSP